MNDKKELSELKSYKIDLEYGKKIFVLRSYAQMVFANFELQQIKNSSVFYNDKYQCNVGDQTR